MDMNVTNVPVSNFNWDGLVEKLKDVAPEAKITDMKATSDESGMNVTITVGEGDAAMTSTISIPDLDAPGQIDATEFASLVAKLEDAGFLELTDEEMQAVNKAFNEFAATPLPESTGNVLFDIYALMALMLEALQSQRDSARELRQAENQAIQTAIHHQAQSQRDAAIVGMVVGIVVGVVQMVMQGMALSKSMAGNKMQRTALQESGIGPAQNRADAAKANFDAQSQTLQNKQTQLDAAETNVREVTATRDSLRADLDTKQQAVTEKTTLRDTAQQELDALPQDAPAETRQAAQQRLETANTELADATAARDATQTRLTETETRLEGATRTRDDALQQRDAQQRVVDGAGEDMASKQQTLDRAEKRFQEDARNVAGRHQQEKWHNIGGMIGAAGSVLQSTVRSATEIIQAEATEEGAEVKKSEENLDQTRDLFNQAQEVIRSMLSLFAAVIQAESQSMRDAIHA